MTEFLQVVTPSFEIFFWMSNSQILSPWLRNIVDSRIGLSCRPASLCSLAGRYDNPMPESTISPTQGLRIWLLDSDKFFFWSVTSESSKKYVIFVWARTLIWPLYCKGQRPWRIAVQQEKDKRTRWRWSCTFFIYAAPCTATEPSSTLLSYSLPFGLGSAIVSYTATYWAKLHPPDLRSTLRRYTAPYCAELAIFWATLHPHSLAVPKWVRCSLVLLYTAPYTGLRCALLGYKAPFWATTQPQGQDTELQHTLLSYAAPNCATLYPAELLCTLLSYYLHSELHCTLLTYAEPPRRHDAPYLAEVAPSEATPCAEVAPF
jgi:hypothetical protein